MKAYLICLAALILAACGVEPVKLDGHLPPLSDYLDCLPDEAAMISAHRATAYDWDGPENAMSGLNNLSKGGYLMAEVDVARTRDGVYILAHDGVWDEMSTATGPVAGTDSGALDTILLKSRQGTLSSERPATLGAALRFAKDNQLYLEIDFKSSAKYQDVIQLIREASMADQVVLISYNKGQRDKLRALAPEMLLSSGAQYADGRDLIWAGYDAARPLSNNLNPKKIIGRVKAPDKTQGLALAKSQAVILVTDDANRYLPITGLTQGNKADYEACLAGIN